MWRYHFLFRCLNVHSLSSVIRYFMEVLFHRVRRTAFQRAADDWHCVSIFTLHEFLFGSIASKKRSHKYAHTINGAAIFSHTTKSTFTRSWTSRIGNLTVPLTVRGLLPLNCMVPVKADAVSLRILAPSGPPMRLGLDYMTCAELVASLPPCGGRSNA